MSHISLLLFLQNFFLENAKQEFLFHVIKKNPNKHDLARYDPFSYRKEEKCRAIRKHRKAQFYRFFYKDQRELLLYLFQYYSLEFAEVCRGQSDFLQACQNCLT